MIRSLSVAGCGLWALAMLVGGCFSDATPASDCIPGLEGCMCVDLQCEQGLACMSGVCIPEAGTGSMTTMTPSASADGPSSGGGTATQGGESSTVTGDPPPSWEPQELWRWISEGGEGDSGNAIAFGDQGSLWIAGARTNVLPQVWVGHLSAQGEEIGGFEMDGQMTGAGVRGGVLRDDGRFLLGGIVFGPAGDPTSSDQLAVEFATESSAFSPLFGDLASPGTDWLEDIDIDGDQTITAGLIGSNGTTRGSVAAYDGNGNLVWSDEVGSEGLAAASTALVVDAGGGDLAAVGWLTNGGGDRDAWIRRYQLNGVERWTQMVGGAGDQAASDIGFQSSGSYVVVGTSDAGEQGLDVWVQRRGAATGSAGWIGGFDNGNDDLAVAVAIGPDDSVYACGSTIVPGGDAEVLVVKYSSDGDELGHLIVDGPHGDDLATDCALTEDGHLVVTGSYWVDAATRTAFVAAYG